MGVIHKLSKIVIPKIAAGEVIEGPSGAVKELIENSIDAGAKKITVELNGSGFDSIRITDDGCGISAEDLQVCFLPFYTSKLTTLEDLNTLTTLGFRGEALSSLCAVASVTIKSRQKTQEYGTRVEIRDSEMLNSASFGMNVGTIIEIQGLFQNIPARKKFLKDSKLEFDRILDVVNGYALSYPSISFLIYRDGKLILNLKKGENHNVRVGTILGSGASKHLIPIEFSDAHVSVSGFISKPQLASPNSINQFLFVNNRYVILKDLAKTIKNAYGTLLPHDVYPPFVLFISLNPDLIDVNVHPRKQEVRFWDNNYVLQFITDSIKKSLQNTDLTYVLGDTPDFYYDKAASTETYVSFKDSVPLWRADQVPFNLYDHSFQIANTYIATPLKEGLLLVDQHAAHESILYNELHASYIDKKNLGKVVTLEKPITLSFGSKEALSLINNLEQFALYGFEIYQSSPTDFTVAAIPEILNHRDIQSVVSEFLSEIVINGRLGDLDSRTHRTLAFLACRSAIKAGDYLSQQEQRNILQKLDACNDIYTCPHGRPVKIIVTSRELAKFFKRIK